MKANYQVLGMRDVAGEAKKTGNRYRIVKMIVMQPVEIAGNVVGGMGYEARELQCKPQMLESLNGTKFPANLTLELQINFRNEVDVVSANPVEPAAQAAAKSGQ